MSLVSHDQPLSKEYDPPILSLPNSGHCLPPEDVILKVLFFFAFSESMTSSNTHYGRRQNKKRTEITTLKTFRTRGPFFEIRLCSVVRDALTEKYEQRNGKRSRLLGRLCMAIALQLPCQMAIIVAICNMFSSNAYSTKRPI